MPIKRLQVHYRTIYKVHYKTCTHFKTIPVPRAYTISNISSNTNTNDAKVIPSTPLLRPFQVSRALQTSLQRPSKAIKDSIRNLKPVVSDNTHIMPMNTSSHTYPQATRWPPLLPTPPSSAKMNSIQWLLTVPSNSAINNQSITRPPWQQWTPHYLDYLHQYPTVNSQASQDHTCQPRYHLQQYFQQTTLQSIASHHRTMPGLPGTNIFVSFANNIK